MLVVGTGRRRRMIALAPMKSSMIEAIRPALVCVIVFECPGCGKRDVEKRFQFAAAHSEFEADGLIP
jgi:hypothetical protein